MMTPRDQASVYERIRQAVFIEGTRPDPDDQEKHKANQTMLREALRGLCDDAVLRLDMSANELWRHVWQKIRYAGFRAAYVTDEIRNINDFFRDFQQLGLPDWHYDPNAGRYGRMVRCFLDKTGPFADVRYNSNERKLAKILQAARSFREFDQARPASPVLQTFVGDGFDDSEEAFWRAHERIAKLTGFTTALHIMMDVGFNCVKPDRVLVYLMCRLGWIEDALPRNLTRDEVTKRYQSEKVARSVIRCARNIVPYIRACHDHARIRGFDFVMVKYGQEGGECGVVRNLDKVWKPVVDMLEWEPSVRLTETEICSGR